MTSIGVNLVNFAHWETEYPFLDRMKSAQNWYATFWGGPTGSAVPLDANGVPTGIPVGSNGISTSIGLDPPTGGTLNQYVLTYDGTANFDILGGTIISRSAGRIVFSCELQTPQLTIKDLNSNDPVHYIHVVRADQESLFNSGEIFSPDFLARADDWSVLRFMDWGATNINTLTSWSQRTTPNSLSWADSGGAASVPLEVMVALANRVHTDMWINIPHAADDDYVRRTMSYIRDNLAPGLKVHLEYSNEVWNGNFIQAHYAQDMANQLWGTDANHDGHVDDNDPNERVWAGNNIYYGYRAAQIASIAQQVFGAQKDRVENVLAGFTYSPGMADVMAQGIARANVGTPQQLFSDLAITTYFGDALSGGSVASRTAVLGWARAGAAGLDAAFHEMEFGDLGLGLSPLAAMPAIYAAQKAVADRYGLNLVAYEGGLHDTAYGYDQSVQNEIVDFFHRVLADPRMGALYMRMATDFSAAGGTQLVAFNDVGQASVFGTWGMVDTIYSPTTARYDALAGINSTTAPLSVSTPLDAYMLSVNSISLTFTGTGNFTGVGNALNNVLNGGNGGAHLYGQAGNDTLVGGTGADYLDGGPGVDQMSGGAGDDVYIVDDLGDVIVEIANQGSDEIRTALASYTLGANLERLVATGTGVFAGAGNELDNVITGAVAATNSLYGNAGSDTLTGGPLADYLDGGTGADRMVGGAGDDIYIVDNTGDVVVEVGNEGVDEVRTTLAAYLLPTNVENLRYTGTSAFDGTGNELANIITGGATSINHLAGGAGNDALIGGAAADYLDGGYGVDRMVGGAGNDVYIVDEVGDVVVELSNEGTDEIRTTLISYTLPDNVENLVFSGTGHFTGTGNALANTLTGGAGDDRLDGGAGADIMIGGVGDDTYVVDTYADQIVELAGGGTDTIRTSLATYTLAANLENLTFTGTGPATLVGNDANNVLRGSLDGANRITAGAGNDQLIGGSGADWLDGGTGSDFMSGGTGNDVYIVDSEADGVEEFAGGGTDEVRAYTSRYVLGAYVENLTYLGTGDFNGVGNASANVIVGGQGNDQLIGNDGNDTMIGNDGNDSLDGGTGTDLLIGGAGNDWYYVDDIGDRVVENFNQGTDVISSSVSYTLSANVEWLVLTGTAAIGRGNELANAVIGNSSDNMLYGLDGDDQISGNDGNDTLDGGSGNDVLQGGAGNDRLVGGAGKDVLTGGTGADTFVFAPGDLASDSNQTDNITDFSRTEGDKIDLTGFRPGNLSFIGTGAFTHHSGEVRMDFSNGLADVIFDLNGDGLADLHLFVSSRSGALVASDFLF